jgi:hypothetical protein
MSAAKALDPQRRYSVVQDFDGLHIVPTYRIIRRGETLLCGASLLDCGNFVAAYVAKIAAGDVAGTPAVTDKVGYEVPWSLPNP